jgi:hypothetical protein
MPSSSSRLKPASPHPQRRAAPAPERARDRQARDLDRVRDLWSRARSATGTVVEIYLREARGLDLCAIGGLPRAIRYVPELPYWHEGRDGHRVRHVGPAMVAAMVDLQGRIAGVHRTWLQADGSAKAVIPDPEGAQRLVPRKMLGHHRGTCIPLSRRAAAMQGGEGIETALAGFCAVPELPAVALGSLGNFAGDAAQDGGSRHHHGLGRRLPSPRPDLSAPGWLPPPDCRRFTWLADMDGADLQSSEMLVARGAARLAAHGIEAFVARPPVGFDFNSMLIPRTETVP